MEGWKDGRMEGWKDVRKEGRKEGRKEDSVGSNVKQTIISPFHYQAKRREDRTADHLEAQPF